MVKLRNNRISRRTVDAIAVERDTVFWDSELQGFGVRVYPSGRKVDIVQTRALGEAKKRITIGRYEDLSPSEARRRAAAVIVRIRSDKEPAAPTRRRS